MQSNNAHDCVKFYIYFEQTGLVPEITRPLARCDKKEVTEIENIYKFLGVFPTHYPSDKHMYGWNLRHN